MSVGHLPMDLSYAAIRGAATRALEGIVAGERHVVGRVDVPFGSSLLRLARV